MHLNQADIETTGDPVVPIADAVTPEEVARSISASFSEWRPADPQHLPLYFPRIPRLAPMVTVRDIKLAEHAEAVARTSGLGLSLADASPLDLNLLAFGDAPAYEGLLREMSEVVSLVSRQTKKDLRDLSFFGGPIDRLSPIRIAPIHGPLQFVVETMTRDAVKELALLETAERTDFCDLPQSSVESSRVVYEQPR
ncbi:MAG: hypothetical protein KJ938_03650 [Actinobacteria bacterium]|jgi:hypothetical protein|nr:hypothetical protein [Actinomycetota bacterium]